MKSITALANKAYLSILGSIGDATSIEQPNALAQTNGAPIGPANTLAFDSSAFICKKSGRVRILVFAVVEKAGGTLAPLDTMQIIIRRDGATQVGGASATTVEADANGLYCLSYGFDDTGIALGGAGHTWGLLVSIANAHTGVLPTAGATVMIQEL